MTTLFWNGTVVCVDLMDVIMGDLINMFIKLSLKETPSTTPQERYTIRIKQFNALEESDTRFKTCASKTSTQPTMYHSRWIS